MLFVVAFYSYYAGGSRAWTRQASWYVPCGEAMCIVCRDFVVSTQLVSMFDYAGGARAWTRQAPWYLPCGETVCIVCREFVACVHALLTLFANNRSIYT